MKKPTSDLKRDVDPFINLTLRERYQIVSYLCSGQCGNIYTALDKQKGDKGVVIKISTELELIQKEFKVLNSLNKSSSKSSKKRHFPKIYDGGEFIIDQYLNYQ